MGTKRNTIVDELRKYDDNKNPETSEYDVLYPKTIPSAVIDPDTKTPLSDKLKEIDDALSNGGSGEPGIGIYIYESEDGVESSYLTNIDRVKTTAGRTLKRGDLLISTKGNLFEVTTVYTTTMAANLITQLKGSSIYYSTQTSNGSGTTTLDLSSIKLPVKTSLLQADLIITASMELYRVTSVGMAVNASVEYINSLKGAKGDKGDPGTNGVTPTIKAANGSDIGNVGTPSVTASTVGTETTFTFHNLKGEPGPVDTSLLNNKMDKANPTGTGSFSLNRNADVATGSYSAAFGSNGKASGKYSAAFGINSSASNDYTAAFGSNTVASGAGSTAFGVWTIASGAMSTAFGGESKAYGDGSAAFGVTNMARGYGSVAFGKHNNDSDSINEPNPTNLLSIGFGTSSSKKNVFRISYTGTVYALSSTINTGADYAEYIKPWFDDNIDNEDRRGYFVTIRNGKLYKAEPGDYIVGITSGNPSVIGNGDEDWLGRWKRDEFNELIYEEVEVNDYETQIDEEGNPIQVKIGSHFERQTVQVENYDPSQEYIERKDRPEWSCVGMIGVIPLRDDGTCEPGGFAKCRGYGIATRADEYRCHETFFVIERINDHIVSVEMR